MKKVSGADVLKKMVLCLVVRYSVVANKSL